MTHVKALQAGHSSQGTSEPITPAHRGGFRACCEWILSNSNKPCLLIILVSAFLIIGVLNSMGISPVIERHNFIEFQKN